MPGVNSQDITLQLAARSDAQTIAAMSRDLIEDGLGWEYRPERICALIADRDTVSLVARDGGRIIGFAIMSFGADYAHLVLMAVRPVGQRRGIARRMTQWLIESAATAGVASIHLELRAQNKDAYAFYRALGFTETLRLPGYYRARETAIRMIQVLRPPNLAPQPWSPPGR
jgi:[ribosomal protein S18]-alanine N-acetyltransferase